MVYAFLLHTSSIQKKGTDKGYAEIIEIECKDDADARRHIKIFRLLERRVLAIYPNYAAVYLEGLADESNTGN